MRQHTQAVYKSFSDLHNLDLDRSVELNKAQTEYNRKMAEKAKPCSFCKLSGPNIVRIDGVCETCYTLLQINPIQKEIKVAEDILTQLNNSLYERLQKLGREHKVQLDARGPNPYKCRKCGKFATDEFIKLIYHEENFCAGEKVKPRSNKGQQRLKIKKPEAGGFFDE